MDNTKQFIVEFIKKWLFGKVIKLLFVSEECSTLNVRDIL